MLPTDNWRGNNDVLDSLAATTAFNLGKPERPFGVFDLDFIESSKELFDFKKKTLNSVANRRLFHVIKFKKIPGNQFFFLKNTSMLINAEWKTGLRNARSLDFTAKFTCRAINVFRLDNLV